MRSQLTRARRTALAGAAVAALAALGVPAPAGAAVDARLQGQFTMKGTITRADNVRGEHKGQHVKRRWRFDSHCAKGPCDKVVLHRHRSVHRVDRLVLHRDGPGSYSGKNSFHFPLRCAGVVYPHGGEARVKITVRVTGSTTVQNQAFATNLRATYSNPRRINHTECGGDLGRDGARYSGGIDTVPGPPAAAFKSSQPTPPSRTVRFEDKSKRGAGRAPIASRSWDFGDPGSGAKNSASGRRPSHTFSGPGNYTVTLTVTDANGLTSQATRQFIFAAR